MSETISFSGGSFTLPTEVPKGDTPVSVTETTIAGQDVFVIAPEKGSGNIKGLSLDGNTDGTPIIVDANVKDFNVNFGDTNDTLVINGNVGKNADLNFGVGDDSFSAEKSKKPSSLSMGDGNDNVDYSARVEKADIDLGSGDDTLVFGGNVSGIEVQLGSGADAINFAGKVKKSSIDLGSDQDIDTIRFSSESGLGSMVITGAGENDILFIGSAEYSFNSSTDSWTNIADPSDTRNFS